MRKLKKGFTIIELVIVIAVIAVLTAVLVPTFIGLSKKAGDSNDKTIVKNANIQLAAQESLEGKNKSMSEAVKDVDEIGYHMSSVPTSNGNKIVWDKTTDRFVLLDKNNNVLLSDGNVSSDHNKLFLAVSNLENIGDFAIYAKSNYSGTTSFTSAKSFDAGDKEDIASISYVFNGSGAVLVVTNSEETEITVNTPNAEFEHTGLSKKILITAVANDTFKDFGHVGYVEINAGHYVADQGADIKAVYATSANAKVDIQNGGKIENAYGGAETYTGDNSKGNVELDYSENKAAIEDQAITDLDQDINPQPIDAYAALVAQIESDPRAATAVYASVCAGETEYFYDSLPEAFTGKTVNVVMLKNTSDPYIVFSSGNYVFDLNGHTVTFGEDGIGTFGGAVVTIKDVKGTGVGRFEHITPVESTLIFESGYYDIGAFGFPEMGMPATAFGGSLIINGGTYTIDPSTYLGLGHTAEFSDGVWVVR